MAQAAATSQNQPGVASARTGAVLEILKAHYTADRHLRRGLCLLNAGAYQEAADQFKHAAALKPTDRSLPARLAACLIGEGRFQEAAAQLTVDAEESGVSPVTTIRRALALAAGGDPRKGIDTLRDALRDDTECAELHFQLGTLLTTVEEYEEAELRFAQAANIDRDHSEALVNLALCGALRGASGDALAALQRAQRLRPHDTRIAILLAQAAQSQKAAGRAPRLDTAMPDQTLACDVTGIQELSRAIEADPDFVDAFLSIPQMQVNQQVYSMLLSTIRLALERQPEHAELHFHCGRVLERLGRRHDAILESEAAIRIKPRYVRALIELAKLYRQTERHADAAARLEQAVAAGGEFADVYVMLGELYQQQGEVGRARLAYQRALHINGTYKTARDRLAALQT